MKYFHSIILTGLIVHLLPLNAEEATYSLSSILVSDDEMSLSDSLDAEISLLEDEFDELTQELALDETVLENTSPFVTESKEAEVALTEPALEAPIALETQTPSLEDVSAAPHITQEIAELPSQEPLDAVVASLPALIIESSQLQGEVSQEDLKIPSEQLFDNADLPLIETLSLEPQGIIAENDAAATLNVQGTSLIGELSSLDKEAISVDLKQAFAGSPVIYSLLLGMSVFSVCIWLYCVLSIRFSARISPSLLNNMQNKLTSNNFEEALSFCQENSTIFCKMVQNGIQSRKFGLPIMIEAMKAEGKRSTISFWQKIGLLNDVAIIAPMLGLLGTVLGMFYAFYDVNRSIESVSTLFDGLGISVGTTVAGLIVAILALILHSTAKYRLVRSLAQIESQTQNLALLMDDRTSIYKG